MGLGVKVSDRKPSVKPRSSSRGQSNFKNWLKKHDNFVAATVFFLLTLITLFPAALVGKVVGPEDLLQERPPLTQVASASHAGPSNYLLSDPVEVFHPDLRWTRNSLHNGNVPLWNNRVFAGAPTFSMQQTAGLYPTNWLAYALPFFLALTLIAILKVTLAAFGTWLFCRAFNFRRSVSFFAGISFGFSACFVIWLEHSHANAYLLLPWMLWLVDRVCRSARIRDAAGLAAVTSLLWLGGHPGSFLLIGLMAVAYALFRVFSPQLDEQGQALSSSNKGRVTALLLGAGLLGIAASTVTIFPFIELLRQSTDTARGSTQGLPAKTLLTLFLPEAWGRPDSGFELPLGINYAERTVYIGALPLMLAAAGFAIKRSREQWFFAGTALFSAVLALGVPFISSFLRSIPPFSQVSTVRAVVLLVFSLVILAAWGLKDLLVANRAERRRALLVAGAVFMLPLLWALLHPSVLSAVSSLGTVLPWVGSDPSDYTHTAAASVLRWIFFGAVSLVVIASINRDKQNDRGAVLYVVVALVVIDLGFLGHGFHPMIDRSVADSASTPSIEKARALQGSNRVIGEGEYLIPNLPVQYGLRDARGHGLPVMRRFLKLYNAYGGYGFQATRFDSEKPGAKQILDTFGIKVLLTGYRKKDPPIDGLKKKLTGPDERVYLNSSALPRAWFTTGQRSVGGEDAARNLTVSSDREQLFKEPVLEVDSSAEVKTPKTAPVKFILDGDRRITLETNAPAAGHLVLLDAFYPGWQATVDGQKAEIVAANGAFRAVALSAGRHRIEFVYSPWSFKAGALISAAAWLLILVGLLGHRLRRKAFKP